MTTFTPGDTGRTRDGLGDYAIVRIDHYTDGASVMLVVVNHPTLFRAQRIYYTLCGGFTGENGPDHPLDLLPPTRSE